MPYTAGEKGERYTGNENESRGETEMRVFRVGRVNGWAGLGSLVIRCMVVETGDRTGLA